MKDADFVTIDGRRFHFDWLRDNCPCPQCRDSTSYQKIHDPIERAAVPLKVELLEHTLVLSWQDDPRPHRIGRAWLGAYAYDRQREDSLPDERVMWDHASLAGAPPVIHDTSNVNAGAWMDSLAKWGFVRIGHLARAQLQPFVATIGPISHYISPEPFISIKIVPGGGEDLGLSSHALSPHSDLSYMPHMHPLIVGLYCVENNSPGGESILVDGHRVASDLAREAPEDFERLRRTPVTFRQFDPVAGYHFSRTTPIIRCNPSGTLLAIAFSQKNFSVDIPFDEMKTFYRSYCELMARLKSPDYQIVFKLEPEQLLLVENERVLHGRRAFDPRLGSRHFEAFHVSWDYLAGRRNFAARVELESKQPQTGA
jgi:alpha-ketoglutarate-dependent taurine dioxygenase